jgi:hypothetical protein
MQVAGAAVLIPVLGAFAASAPPPASSAGAPPAVVRRAVLTPAAGTPFRVRGSRFLARERVRVTVTPTGGRGITRRVTASARGTFVLTFEGVLPCRGVNGRATGSRGSRASFAFSSFRCPRTRPPAR